MDQKIRLGVVGCGYWGPNLIRNYAELPSAEVVAVVDLKDQRLSAVQKRYPAMQVTKNYHDLLDMDLDAVVVATPPRTHYPIARKCLENSLHVMVEKPFTLESSHAQGLVDLASQVDRVLMVGHTFEYNPAVHTLKRLIEEGEIGQIYYVDCARLNLGLFQRGLNVLWDLAPHDISILLYLLDMLPTSVSAQGMQCAIPGVYDNVYVNLVFPHNILAHVHVSWIDPCKVRRVTIVGSKKMVVYNDMESVEKIKIYDKGVDLPAYNTSYEDFQCSYRSGDIVIPQITFEEPLRQECQHFVDCIRDHREPRSGGRDGLRVVKVLEHAEKSLRNNHSLEQIRW